MSPKRTLGICLATLTSLLWGTVPIAGKVALPGITASSLSVLRLGVAAVFMLAVLRWRTGTPVRTLLAPPPRLLYLAAVGLACNYAFYMLGLERAGAATSQVLIQLAPLFLMLLGIVWLKERPRRRQLVGASIALVGLVLVSWASGGGAFERSGTLAVGIGCIVFSALMWGVYAAAHKRLGDHHDAGRTMMWIFALSAILIAPTIPFEPARHADGVQGWAIGYLCVISVVSYSSFAESLRHLEASLVAVITTLGPVVTFALVALNNRLGWDRIGYEPLGASKLMGAGLVLIGVLLAVARRRPRATSAAAGAADDGVPAVAAATDR